MSRWPTKETMRERILETTDRLFYGQGIRAVGVDTIADEIGISKRTLYNYFPSKDALIVAYLSRRFIPLTVSDLPPVQQILGAFNRLERSFAREEFRGCPFVNAVAELGKPTHAATAIAVAFKEQRRIWFRDLLTQLNVMKADGLATQLTLLVDGAIAAALVRGDPGMAREAREAARVLLSAAGVQVSADVGEAENHRIGQSRNRGVRKLGVTRRRV
jgi:AcrR family transcriptional regulator